MSLPLISVVTISMNQAAFLDECIRSVVEQDYPALEYIVVDPGSTDGSRDIIARHQAQIATVILDPDEGPADGLNQGFARARGEVFAYLNADDLLRPGALRFMGEYFAAHPEVDVVCGAIRIINREGFARPRKRTADLFDLRRYAAGICTVGQQATFIRRRAFERTGGFNIANRTCWDGELLVDMALNGARFHTVPKVIGDFRIYGDSITGSKKFREQTRSDHERIRKKIASHGIRLYAPLQARLKREVYRFNLLRHLRYLLVR